MTVHLLKLCVGIERVEDLAHWQAVRRRQRAAAGEPAESFHRTRHFPRRADEVLAGGSIYWIIKGFIQVRQGILRFDERPDDEEGKRCGIILHPDLVRTELQARRPHQGWRYLEPRDAPRDLGAVRTADVDEVAPSPEMAAELRALGLI